MDVDEAEKIVDAFADVMAEHSEWILEAGLLRHSKAHIHAAFDVLLLHYEALCRLDPVCFREKGYDKIVDSLGALRLRVNEFNEIEEEDRADVGRINALSRNGGLIRLAQQLESELLPESESVKIKALLIRAGALFQKYTGPVA